MNMPLEATQPPAEKLVSYDEFLRRLETLRSSPRVRVERVGQSHGERGIYLIVVASEKTIPCLERHKSLSATLQKPQVIHTTLFQLQKRDRVTPREDIRFPVLVAGLSFGHEAAHVEAHLQLAERLAWGEDDEISAILGRLVVLVMPMLNPDGRMMSIETWKRYPLAEDSSAGNLYGFYINRDFLHLTQPETKALLQVYREWHPLAVLDTHEDVFCLGVQVPEVCWCPAFGVATVEGAPQNIKELVGRLGEAIRKEWDRLGFNYYQSDMFAHPMPGEPEGGPYWMASGNLVQTMALHGIPSVITESGRTPGVQTWEDRVQQKLSAALALLREVAKDPESIAEMICGNREQAIEEAQGSGEVFVIPKEQKELAAVAQLVDTLLQHDVRVYEIDEPYEAFVVPLAQDEAEVVRTLISARKSQVVAMPPALGVAVAGHDTLSEDLQGAFKKATLRPVIEAPVLTVTADRGAHSSHYAIPNTTEGVKLINRSWQIGSAIYWLSQPLEVKGKRFDNGTFVIEQTPRGVLETLAQGLGLEIYGLPKSIQIEAHRIQRPRVALYVGQGVDRPDATARADIWWALERLGFGFAPLQAEDIIETVLGRYDTLIVPGGDPYEIVNGWGEDALLNRSPWELPGKPQGIGSQGLKAISQFVEEGGGYVGISSGGGLLALSDYADLIDLEVMAHGLGSARVLVRVDRPNHPLMFGLNGYYDESGRWLEGLFPAYYHSEAFTNTPGGPIFRAGKNAMVLASYYRVDHEPASRQVIQESFLTEEEGGVAVAFQKVGKGQVAAIGVRPGFRALWTNTWKLLSNPIFLGAAEQPQAITLP